MNNPAPPRFLVVQAIWMGMFMSSFLLLAPLYVLNPEEFRLDFSLDYWRPLMALDLFPVLRPLFVVAALLLATSKAIPRFLFQTMGKALPAEATADQKLEVYLTPFIVRLAMLEAVVLIGFVSAYVITHDSRTIVPFLVVAVLNYLYVFPSSIEKLERDFS